MIGGAKGIGLRTPPLQTEQVAHLGQRLQLDMFATLSSVNRLAVELGSWTILPRRSGFVTVTVPVASSSFSG